MKNFFKRCSALVMVASLLVMSGCKTEARKEFVKVNGVPYYEDEMYANIYYSIGSSYLGIMEYDETADKEKIRKAVNELEANQEYGDYVRKQKVAFVKQKVCDARLLAVAKEQGITLSEDEMKQVNNEYATVENFFNSQDTLTKIKDQFYATAENAEQSSKTYLENYKRFYLSLYAVENMEQLKNKFTEMATINKVLENKSSQIAEDEEYIKNYYNTQLESQKKKYTENISNFDADYDAGNVICYYPSGLRYVKHILIGYTDEDQEMLLQYETQVSQLEGKEAPTDEEKASLQDLKTKIGELSAKMDGAALAKANEVYAKINSGGDFEALLKEYGEDPGMSGETSKHAQKGYLISESSNMVKEFITVSMALKEPGDISKPVKSSYGYHIIKYMEKGREGEVPYDEVRSQLANIAMEEKRTNETTKYYDTLYDEMIASGKVEINYDALGFNKETYDKLYNEMMSLNMTNGEQTQKKGE